jgi:peptide/nickel transport system substrate-binding protein
MAQEPESLFLYGDASAAARAVRQAIYDGPVDWLGYQAQPVIFERLPSLENGDVFYQTVDAVAGDLIVDASGAPATLAAGVRYLPAGCLQEECALEYGGEGAVRMDQMAARFRLRSSLLWSDGQALRADDSVYSFELAQALYPRARADLLPYTRSYTALDEQTVEWRGLPGYSAALYHAFFFTPLPRHAWGLLPAEDLLTAETATRAPLGWGPYQIEEWTAGDHITLVKNPRYFRAAEGLPHFDRLVFRFVDGPGQALAALQAGECDFFDLSGMAIPEMPTDGAVKLISASGSAWEHLDFGLLPASGEPAFLFQNKETRRALAMCLDRTRLAAQVYAAPVEALQSYVSATHPLFVPPEQPLAYNPRAAAELLTSLGWVDEDGDASTPRLSQGAAGVPDGLRMTFTYLTLDGGAREAAARMIQEMLSVCGVGVTLETTADETLFTAGPEGPVFGRQFQAAQFAWSGSLQPPCFLFTSTEIPGPYPQYARGWGGANASGYANPAFDAACRQALRTPADSPEHRQAQALAQSLFAADLPVIPLYTHPIAVAVRSDFCGAYLDASAESALWNIENFDYGNDCQ